jgi:hypothetical protein
VFGEEHEKSLRNYLELPSKIPSLDTIQRVFAMVPSEFPENFPKQWNEMGNSGEGSKLEPLPAKTGRFVMLLKQPNVRFERVSSPLTFYPISKLSELLFS